MPSAMGKRSWGTWAWCANPVCAASGTGWTWHARIREDGQCAKCSTLFAVADRQVADQLRRTGRRLRPRTERSPAADGDQRTVRIATAADEATSQLKALVESGATFTLADGTLFAMGDLRVKVPPTPPPLPVEESPSEEHRVLKAEYDLSTRTLYTANEKLVKADGRINRLDKELHEARLAHAERKREQLAAQTKLDTVFAQLNAYWVRNRATGSGPAPSEAVAANEPQRTTKGRRWAASAEEDALFQPLVDKLQSAFMAALQEDERAAAPPGAAPPSIERLVRPDELVALAQSALSAAWAQGNRRKRTAEEAAEAPSAPASDETAMPVEPAEAAATDEAAAPTQRAPRPRLADGDLLVESPRGESQRRHRSSSRSPPPRGGAPDQGDREMARLAEERQRLADQLASGLAEGLAVASLPTQCP